MTGGKLQLRTRDLASLGQLVLQRGSWQGRQIVRAAWIDQALSVQRRPSAEQDPNGELEYELDAVAVVTTINYNTRGMHQQTTRLLEQHVLPRLDCTAAG